LKLATIGSTVRKTATLSPYEAAEEEAKKKQLAGAYTTDPVSGGAKQQLASAISSTPGYGGGGAGWTTSPVNGGSISTPYTGTAAGTLAGDTGVKATTDNKTPGWTTDPVGLTKSAGLLTTGTGADTLTGGYDKTPGGTTDPVYPTGTTGTLATAATPQKTFALDSRTGVGQYTDTTGWKVNPATGRLTMMFNDGTFSNVSAATPEEESAYQAQRQGGSALTGATGAAATTSPVTNTAAAGTTGATAAGTGTTAATAATSGTGTYSDVDYISGIANQLYSAYTPQMESDIRANTQQYGDLGRQQNEYAAQLGMNRSGQAIQNIGNLGQQEINANSDIRTQALLDSYTRALPYAEFGFTESQAGKENEYKYAALAQEAANSAAANALAERELTQQGSQFDQSLAQSGSQYSQTLAQQIAEAERTAALNRDKLTADTAQNQEANAIAREQLAADIQQSQGNLDYLTANARNELIMNLFTNYMAITDKATLPTGTADYIKALIAKYNVDVSAA
jgi:hypothetical protein